MEQLSKKKKFAIVVAVLFLVFLILDFDYVVANVKFFFFKPRVFVQSISPVTQKVQPNILTISSLGIMAPIQYPSIINEAAYQAALINGVAHYPGTALPGQPGNCYIFGHSSDFIWSKGHYKTVFAVLPLIKAGAEITVSDQQGKEFVYIVTDSHEVSANDLSVLSQSIDGQKFLTLQTSFPVGTALARWIVVAEMK